MTDTTTGSQPTAPGGTPNGQNQSAPVPLPPGPQGTSAPAPVQGGAAQPAGQQPVGQQPAAPAQGDAKTFTQDELDHHLNDRMDRFKKSMGAEFAKLFGIDVAGEGGAKPDAEQVLAQARQVVEQAQTRANTATARSFAATSVRDDRIDTLVGMIDVNAALANVDANDANAVNTAIKAAVDAEAAKFPEWSRTAAPQLPGSSTANPNQQTGDGKRIYTRAELQAMSQRDLAAIADDLALANREGRIK
jgi:hypothetical protein